MLIEPCYCNRFIDTWRTYCGDILYAAMALFVCVLCMLIEPCYRNRLIDTWRELTVVIYSVLPDTG